MAKWRIPAQEYPFLRTEIDVNKKFVFERPLLILGVAVGLTGTMVDTGALSVTPTLLLGLLYFNLWFTNNRLRSSSRIIAYLQLVHETRSRLSPGWEEALRMFRIRVDEDARANRLAWRRRTRGDAQYDDLRFYPALFWFHLLLGGGVALAQTVAIVTRAKADVLGWPTVVNVVALVAYVALCVPFRPGPTGGIEEYRRAWKATLPRRKSKRGAR